MQSFMFMPISCLSGLSCPSFTLSDDLSCSTSSPGGHLVGGLPPAANNDIKEKVGNVERQTIWGNLGLKWRVLRLCPSDRDETQDKPSTGIKESCPRRS